MHGRHGYLKSNEELSAYILLYSHAQVMMDFLKEWEEKLAIKITCSQAQPLTPLPQLHSSAPHAAAHLPQACAAEPGCHREPVPCICMRCAGTYACMHALAG
jgi:hypothetical protein